MEQPPFEVSAARALVDQLLINGVDRAYCVPGESYLSVLDACYERGLPLTVCRNEAGAAMMADAYGKATGKPGICFVTRGPGAANAFAGVHIAAHDSTPMILFIGQVERFARGRGAFQEVDYPAMFGGEAKWVAEISEASRVNEFVSRAFVLAGAGRPGPVVLSLPKDMLEEPIRVTSYPAAGVVETAPGGKDMRELERLIAAAGRPLLILGGTRWDEEARGALRGFAERFDMPVATSYRRLPLFDALDPRYAGDLGLNANPELIKLVQDSDFLLLVRGRLGEIPSQSYRLLDIPSPRMTFVHVYPQAEEFGRVYAPNLAIHASPRAFARALGDLRPPENIPWRERTSSRAPKLYGFFVAKRAVSRCRSGAGHAVAERQSSRRRHHLQWRGQLRLLDPSLLPISALRGAYSADFRQHGIRCSGGGGDATAFSEPAGCVHQRRWRFPDERAGIRDGRAI